MAILWMNIQGIVYLKYDICFNGGRNPQQRNILFLLLLINKHLIQYVVYYWDEGDIYFPIVFPNTNIIVGWIGFSLMYYYPCNFHPRLEHNEIYFRPSNPNWENVRNLLLSSWYPTNKWIKVRCIEICCY